MHKWIETPEETSGFDCQQQDADARGRKPFNISVFFLMVHVCSALVHVHVNVACFLKAVMLSRMCNSTSNTNVLHHECPCTLERNNIVLS